jgi:hypothetical protein
MRGKHSWNRSISLKVPLKLRRRLFSTWTSQANNSILLSIRTTTFSLQIKTLSKGQTLRWHLSYCLRQIGISQTSIMLRIWLITITNLTMSQTITSFNQTQECTTISMDLLMEIRVMRSLLTSRIMILSKIEVRKDTRIVYESHHCLPLKRLLTKARFRSRIQLCVMDWIHQLTRIKHRLSLGLTFYPQLPLFQCSTFSNLTLNHQTQLIPLISPLAI